MSEMPLVVRPGEEADLGWLTRLYNHYVEHTVITFDLRPSTVEERRATWFARYAPTGRHRLLVAERAGTPVGYATSSPFRPKPAYAPSVETTIYLQPDAAGRGDGTTLYTALLGELASEDVHRAYGGVALPNEASLRLHRRLGFTQVGVQTEVGRKFDRWIDVAWLERGLP